MKYSKTTTDKSELTLKAAFPHRYLKKSLPKISEKVIPTHFIEINQLYQGKVNELLLPEQWAYIPIKAHKKSQFRRSNTEGTEVKSREYDSHSSKQFRSTSQVFLKKYLKRKQVKQLKDVGIITNYVGRSEDKKQNTQSNYLEAIIQFNTSKLEKYKTETHQPEKEKHSTLEQKKTSPLDGIKQFKSQKVQLKEKLKIYETNIKNKRFEIKIADRRYKNILHNFESISRE